MECIDSFQCINHVHMYCTRTCPSWGNMARAIGSEKPKQNVVTIELNNKLYLGFLLRNVVLKQK